METPSSIVKNFEVMGSPDLSHIDAATGCLSNNGDDNAATE